MYHSYSVNDMPRPIPPNHKDIKTEEREAPKSRQVPDDNVKVPKKFLDEDVMLLIVIFLLLASDCEDTLLLLALIYVFLMGYIK